MPKLEIGTHALWHDDPAPDARPTLGTDASCDCCVIGGGMAGVLSAYALASAGAKVVLLEKDRLGGGDTGRTTAHLACAVDDRFATIEERDGRDVARVSAESHSAAIEFLERTALRESIDCDFLRLSGYLFLPPGGDRETLAEEQRAAERAGLRGVELLSDGPEGSPARGSCLRFREQGQFHPLRFLRGVVGAVERLGGVVHEHAGVRGVRSEGGGGLVVESERGPVVRAASVVCCTNSPITERTAIHTKQSAYRTYVVVARAERDAVPAGLYWDTSQAASDPEGPYHYVRLSPGPAAAGYDHVIVGGEDHRTGAEVDEAVAFTRLEAWAREAMPALGAVTHRWSGQVFEPLDRRAFIGASPGGPRGLFVVTGDSGMGMTHSAVAALMMPALVAGKGHAWERVYDPSRKATSALAGFVQHNLQVVSDLADHVRPADPRGDVRPGEGRVVRVGGRLLAVSRDEDGTLRTRSAVCTHLGCTVRWNNTEKSWDCPCHGSRFARDGEVLNAPAARPLAEADEGDGERATTPEGADEPPRTPTRDEPVRDESGRAAPGRGAGGATGGDPATTDRPLDASTPSRPTSPR